MSLQPIFCPSFVFSLAEEACQQQPRRNTAEAAAAPRSSPPTGEQLRELFQQLTLGAVRGAEALGCLLLLFLLVAPCGRHSAHTASRIKTSGPRALGHRGKSAQLVSPLSLLSFSRFNLESSPAPTSGSTLFVSPKHARNPSVPSVRKQAASDPRLLSAMCARQDGQSKKLLAVLVAVAAAFAASAAAAAHAPQGKNLACYAHFGDPFCRYLLPKKVTHARRVETWGQLPADLQVSTEEVNRGKRPFSPLSLYTICCNYTDQKKLHWVCKS